MNNNITTKEIDSARKLPNDVMFNVWLGVVRDGGSSDDGLRAAWEYDEILRGEPNLDNPYK